MLKMGIVVLIDIGFKDEYIVYIGFSFHAGKTPAGLVIIIRF
jgi:hypothetical protein